MNKKQKIVIGCLLTATVFGYISKEILSVFTCGFPPSEGNEGAMIAGYLSRSQLGYWLDNGKFATIDELIAKGFDPKQDNYKYLMEVTDDAVFVSSYATITNDDICSREQAPLLSSIFSRQNTPTYTFISGLFVAPDNQSKTILCIGNTAGWQKLNRPYLEGNETVCGEGTIESKLTA